MFAADFQTVNTENGGELIWFFMGSSEADARRRRRDTSINAKLAAINSEFHLLDSPPLQRLVRQVSDKDQLEAEEAEEEEDEQIEREIAATRGPNAPPPPSTVQTTPKTPLNQSPTPNPSGGALLRSPPNSPQSSPSGPTNRTQPGSPPPPVNRPQGPPSPPPQPTSPIQINQGEIYLPAGYNRLEIPKIRIGTQTSEKFFFLEVEGRILESVVLILISWNETIRPSGSPGACHCVLEHSLS